MSDSAIERYFADFHMLVSGDAQCKKCKKKQPEVTLYTNEKGVVYCIDCLNEEKRRLLEYRDHDPLENNDTKEHTGKKSEEHKQGTVVSETISNDKKFPRGNSKQVTLESWTLLHIPVDKIVPFRFQFRVALDEDHIQKLMVSMGKKRQDNMLVGNIEPIIVRPHANGIYHLLAGHHRLEAAKRLGLKTIECKVVSCDDEDAFDIAVATNTARKELSDYEKAQAIIYAATYFYRTLNETAERLGISKSTASNLVRCAQADEKVVNLWKEEKLTTGHVKAISTLPKEQQFEIAKKVIHENMSVRDTEQLVKNLKTEQEHPWNILYNVQLNKFAIYLSKNKPSAYYSQTEAKYYLFWILLKCERDDMTEEERYYLNDLHGKDKASQRLIEEVKSILYDSEKRKVFYSYDLVAFFELVDYDAFEFCEVSLDEIKQNIDDFVALDEKTEQTLKKIKQKQKEKTVEETTEPQYEENETEIASKVEEQTPVIAYCPHCLYEFPLPEVPKDLRCNKCAKHPILIDPEGHRITQEDIDESKQILSHRNISETYKKDTAAETQKKLEKLTENFEPISAIITDTTETERETHKIDDQDLNLFEALKNNEEFDINIIAANLMRYADENKGATVITGHELQKLLIPAIINYGHLSAPKESFIQSDAFYSLAVGDDGWFWIYHNGNFECRRENIKEIPEALKVLNITINDLVAVDEKAEQALKQLKEAASE